MIYFSVSIFTYFLITEVDKLNGCKDEWKDFAPRVVVSLIWPITLALVCAEKFTDQK